MQLLNLYMYMYNTLSEWKNLRMWIYKYSIRHDWVKGEFGMHGMKDLHEAWRLL